MSIPAESWLGYWSDKTAERVYARLRGKNMGNASWIILNLIHYYIPICSTVYALYKVRSALLKHMSVKVAFTGTVVSPFFDGLSVMAVPPRRP